MSDNPNESTSFSIESTARHAEFNSSTRAQNKIGNNDFAYDGMWPFTGYGGMMVRLAEDFVKSQNDLVESDPRDNADENDGDDDGDDQNFVMLNDIDGTDEAAIFRIQETLDHQGLRMADGVLRRLVEGCCPPKLRITRLNEDTTMTKLLSLKQEGNRHFSEKGYREAIDCYDAALESVPIHQRDKLHVVPKQQLTELVNLLSNKGESLLRKARYEEAAEVCTEALVFDNGHLKSRLRRAKAGLEIGTYDRYEATSRGDGTMKGVAYLVQAKNDLDEILEHPECTHEGRDAVKKVLSRVNKRLEAAKHRVIGKNSDTEWDMTVLKIQSRCW